MQYHFIINPAAGQGRAAEYIPKIKQFFETSPHTATIHTTQQAGEITSYVSHIAQQTTEELRFYVCGGDGTLNEVINGAVGYSHVAVGLLPSGTGNDFVRCFDHSELFHQLEAQVNGTPVAIDLLRVNHQYAANMLNIGFDCNVAYNASQLKKKPLISGSMAYIAGVFQEFIRKMGASLRIIADGEEISGHFLLSTVANGCFCGGGFQSSPRALLDDGLMDLGVIQVMSRLRFLTLLPSYRSGKYLQPQIQAGRVLYRQCKSLEIIAAQPLRVSIDGEIHPFSRLTIETAPQALRFIVPQGASLMRSR